MKIFSFLTALFCIFISNAQSWQWVKQVSEKPIAITEIITINSNIFVTGGSLTHPQTLVGSGTPLTLHANFLAAYDAHGFVKWVQPFTGGAIKNLFSSEGRIVVTGTFWKIMHLGNFTITPHFDSDIFVACFDTLGTAIWASTLGNECDEVCYSAAADGSGNIYLAGYIPTICDWTYVTKTDVLIHKFNRDGLLLNTQAVDPNISRLSLHAGAHGELYMYGMFLDSLTFSDASSTHKKHGSGSFLVKIDSLKTIQYLKTFDPSIFCEPTSALTDEQQNLYITVKTHPDGFTYEQTSFTANALLKLDQNGALVHSYTFDDEHPFHYSPQLRLTPSKSLLVGWPGPLSIKIAKMNLNLTVETIATITFTSDFAKHNCAFATDIEENFYVAGESFENLNFFPGTHVFIPPNDKLDYGFIAKYGNPSFVGLTRVDDAAEITVFPNPVNETLSIRVVISGTFLLYDALGKLVFEEEVKAGAKVDVNMQSYPQGVYYLRFAGKGKSFSKKIVVN